MSEKNDNHWHLDKRFTVGNLLTTAVVFVTAFYWAVGIEARIAGLAIHIEAAKSERVTHETTALREIGYLRHDIGVMSSKLDRAIESRQKD